MFSRASRNILNVSTNLSKLKINKSSKLIFPTSLTVPKLLVCSSQYSVQHYSSNKESIDKRLTDEDSSDEYSPNTQEQAEDLNTTDSSPYTNIIDKKAQEKLVVLLKENPDKERLKKIIELELTVLQQDCECVPSSLRPRDWLEILQMKSISARRKFYKYLFILEKVDEKRAQQKLEKQVELEKIREERKNAPPRTEIVYGFNQNFMLRRITASHMNHMYQWNCLKAIMYGNKIVFDCSYEKYMSTLEMKSCAKQINESYAANRIHNMPFEIFLTNTNMSGPLIEHLHRYIPILFEKDFPINVTEKSYLELFENSKLCYLTSNAPNVLEKYDHDTIYIIGAYVDKGPKQPISFGKAKKENIRMAKLPLDKFVRFGNGSGKDLTLDQVIKIMLDSQCKSWSESLKHIPTRKLQEFRLRALEQRIKNSMALEENENKLGSHQQKLDISSSGVHDFSHSARSILRDRWKK